MIDEIIRHNPGLKSLLNAKSIRDYLRPAFDWNPSGFQYRKVLQSILLQEIVELHNLSDKDSLSLKNQFENSWSVQTGEHIWIPRVREKAKLKTLMNGIMLPSHHPMVFQGSVLWAAKNFFRNYDFSVLMGTGRVPANNPLSGSYLEVSRCANMIRLIPEKWHSTPQMLIPAINEDALLDIKDALMKIRHILTANEFRFWSETLDLLVRNQSSFANQVALVHSFIMSRIMPIRQLTVESERVAVRFLSELFYDHNSLTHRIFSNPTMFSAFLEKFGNIATGWNDMTTPFWAVENLGKVPRLVEYSGSMNLDNLLQLLNNGSIYPKGVLKFFVFMVEGGLLSIGGICQFAYCTEIRDRAIQFLDSIGEKMRANDLKTMPTEIATIAPCWGVEKSGRLIDVLDCIENPIAKKKLEDILNLSGKEALKNSATILHLFFTGKPALT